MILAHSRLQVCVTINYSLQACYLNFSFLLARACPSDTKVVPHYPGSPAVGVTWNYSGAITDLQRFQIEAETDAEKLPPVNAPASKQTG